MFIKRYLHDIAIAVEAIFANRLKSVLTALGIIFGVAAVISMLAIGNGAEQEILEQIKLVGVNNIVITPSTFTVGEGSSSSNSESGSDKPGGKKFSKGLTLLDVEAIKQVVPTIERISPVISFNYSALLDGKSKPVVLEGIDNHYFDLFNMQIADGAHFNELQTKKGLPVCIIGNNIKNTFFRQKDPLGEYIKCGQVWLKVVGVIEQRDFTASASDELGISSSDNKIFVPVQTILLRFKNRSLLRADEISKANQGNTGMVIIGGSQQKEEPVDTDNNLNQLDKIIVQVRETEELSESATLIKRMLLRRHSDLYDFEVTIPELLLKQQQKTKNIFNVVLGAIAGISLIVGGIGIMNIMLASVMERIREIGVRQAIGAKQKDIIAQFLAESTLISLSGGIIGIILGVVLSKVITAVFDIKTIVSFFSIFIAFGVSVIVGVTFGYLPAKKASENDPVVSLRS